MQIVSDGDNLHEMSNPFFCVCVCKKYKKKCKKLVCWKF